MTLEARLGRETFATLDTTTRTSIQKVLESIIILPTNGFLGRTNVLGLGADLCKILTIEEEMGDPAFLNAVFHPSEVAYSMIQIRPAGSLAARFAAKEAAFKACGFNYREFIVVPQMHRNPTVRLEGGAKEIAQRLGVGDHSLSLSSHGSDYALAIYAALQILPDDDIEPIDIPGRE